MATSIGSLGATGAVAGAQAATTKTLPFGLTGGWYVFFGVGAGVIASGTKAAPLVLGILSIALLYQLSQLVEGK
jgi:hypothetical protein